MRSGIKKFTKDTQGGRTKEGQQEGEKFISFVLDKLGIEKLDVDFTPLPEKTQLKMSASFVVQKPGTDYYILIKSKYKQTPGTDWEKIETSWGFQNYYYNYICGKKAKVVVILSGFWKECQRNLYPTYLEYVKFKYSEDSIFDFGDGIKEIERFAKFMNKTLTETARKEIIEFWKIHKSSGQN